MELKRLIKNTSYLGSTQVVKFLAGIIRAKFNALYLGTFGVGVVNQINVLTTELSRVTTLSMNHGFVRNIAKDKTEDDFREYFCSLTKSYSILVLVFTILPIIISLIFRDKLTFYIFGDSEFSLYFFIALFSFPVLVFNSIPYSILRGFGNMKVIAKTKIIVIIMDIVSFLPLLYFFRLTGALIFIPLSFFISLIVNFYYARKLYLYPQQITFLVIMKSKIRIEYIKDLMTFAGVGFATGIAAVVSDQICRAMIVSSLGVDKIGLYSPITTWAGLFTGFIGPSLHTYLFTRFSESKSNSETNGLLNDALKLSTILMIPFVLIAISSRTFLIPLFYSKEFLDAAIYLPYHFIGMIFFIWYYTLSMVYAPMGYVKIAGIIMVLLYTLNIAVVYSFIDGFGLHAWMLKFIIPPFIIVVINYANLHRLIKFRLSTQNIKFAILLLFSVSGLIILDHLVSNMIINLLFTIFANVAMLMMFNDKEVALLKYKLSHGFKILKK